MTSSNDMIPLKEHLLKLIESNDKRYNERFEAQDKAVAAALAAQKELTSAAFASSEKAIVKAEDSQRTYNAGHNDLSRKMEEQYKLMVPLTEHKADLLNMEKRMDRMGEDVKGLRESRSGVEGKGIGINAVIAYIFGAAGFIAAVFAIIYYLNKK
jgi:hypothetical protein